MQLNQTEFTEVKISVPWGHVAGKWWGPPDVRPILLIHGWLDNAGTFDTLIPLLPKENISYLAIDLPGHGFSSHIPEGMKYSYFDYLWLIHRIQKMYKWDKVSLIGHSLGAEVCFLYSGIFAQHMDMVINLEALKPITNPDLMDYILVNSILRNTKEISNHLSMEVQPTYTKDKVIERMQASSFDSLSPEDCEYLFPRGIRESTAQSGQFYFTSDCRLKLIHMIPFSGENACDVARRISCPLLYISVEPKSTKIFSELRNDEIDVEKMKRENPRIEHRIVEGKHHVHLSHPERVSGLMSEFIQKYRGPKGKI